MECGICFYFQFFPETKEKEGCTFSLLYLLLNIKNSTYFFSKVGGHLPPWSTNHLTFILSTTSVLYTSLQEDASGKCLHLSRKEAVS